MKTITQLFEQTCKSHSEKTACIYKEQKITYNEIKEKVNALANLLIQKKIEHGDRVCFIISKRPELIITYLAIIKVGAINVPLNYKLTSDELSNIISETSPKLIICENEFLNIANSITSASNILTLEQISNDTKNINEQATSYKPSSSDIIAIQYTSGTTSRPKGAAWNHQGVLAHVKAMAETYQITDKDNWLVLLPSFLSSHNSIILPIFTGSTSILMENSNPYKILSSVEKNKANIIMCAAVVCLSLLNLTDAEKYDLSSLRLVIPGGMRFPLKDQIAFEKKFKTQVMDVLAMTEMGIYISNNFTEKRFGSVGKPISGVETKIVDSAGNEVPTGVVGEIVTRGKSMFCAYYNMPHETKNNIKDGWFYTGDLGRCDEDGYFYHASRKKEMINVGGYKIFPQEVEEILLYNEKIEEVAISSYKDSIRGEIPKVFIVLKKNALCTKSDIVKFCHKKIANYKIPKIIQFCESLPKTGSGKICRKALIAM